MTPQELKSIMSHGLLSFPLTDFDDEGNFNATGYAERLEWLAPYGASALFAAGGTGEFFSLTADEYPSASSAPPWTPAAARCPSLPAQAARRDFRDRSARRKPSVPGAHTACLLLPHYLTEAGQEGLIAHVEAGLQEREIRRDRLQPQRVQAQRRLAGRAGRSLPEPDRLQGRHRRHRADVLDLPADGRVAWPTWAACPRPRSMPPPTRLSAHRSIRRPYSTSFPATAMDFYEALSHANDTTTQHRLLQDFFMPYLTIRNRGQGYAVSIVKAGAALVGHSAGPVRVPLTELKPDEMAQLDALIKALGPQ
jgi:5-dehydro-4-deoxyglucarate dehydratase